MKSARFFICLLVLAFSLRQIEALSASIGRDINFPKDYDSKIATEIRAVIQDEQFKFIGGVVSYWPPDWGTRLSFEGDAASLSLFLKRIREIKELGMRILFYNGRNDEQRRDSDWQLDFSHARPRELRIYLNLNAEHLEFDKLELPEWGP